MEIINGILLSAGLSILLSFGLNIFFIKKTGIMIMQFYEETEEYVEAMKNICFRTLEECDKKVKEKRND